MRRWAAPAFLLLAAGAAAENLPELAALERVVAAAPDSRRGASDYRMAIVRAGVYDRALDFFARLVEKHPGSANLWLNYGYAYVDKIPAAGAIGRVILANQSIEKFTRSIELERTWLALYTRGNAYLYWPPVFGKAPQAVADLEAALALVEREPDRRPAHARVYVAMGDAYWRTERHDRARAVWREGARRFPGEPRLAARLARDGDELTAYLYDQLDPAERVDTDLTPLWAEP
ncbi:MAG TPA: tetratricopeptide repeat protein [Thermoanaerobaculia bacterium]|nr:tetratricopeptide repeat protein [Thermoanaerobaculia bacterium]